MKLTDAQIEKIKDLVDEANNYGNTPDWQLISDKVGAEVNENRYKKLVGTYRWSEEDKQKLKEMWMKDHENPNWNNYLATFPPHRMRHIKAELRYLCEKNPDMPKFVNK